MHPFLFASIIGAIRGLKRTCPKCGKPQVVRSEQRDMTVACRFCGAPMPPRFRRE
ncbi:MAG: hypothetical protein AB7E47_04925 [Desulfovibrionaceae bacterium]